MSEIPRKIIEAYLETEYHVLGDPSFMLSIGVTSEPLGKLYKQTRTNCAVFITAWNPQSRDVDVATNKAKQAELAKELSQRSLACFDGIGRHPTGGWPEEPGFFVPGLSLEAAKKLGIKYGQNAVVWCGSDAVPELVTLR